jgi:GT2 family glycosyltransferase
LLFTDDDCIARKDWVERLSQALENEPIVAGSIVSETSNYTKLCHNVAQFHLFMSSMRNGPLEFLAGANMGFRRQVFEKLGGFQESCKTPDTEFALRARTEGYQIAFAPDAVVIHDPERTSIASIIKYASEHASETILIRGRYRSLLHTPAVLSSSVLLLLAAPLIALWVTFAIYIKNPALAKLLWTAPTVYALKLAWCWGAAQGLRKQRSRQSTNISKRKTREHE